MAKSGGFKEYQRENPKKIQIEERIKNFNEFEILLPKNIIIEQASRCMDCGIPFCHTFGCPTNNFICDWNHLVYKNHWEKALELLHLTNNFPEFTGRVCPALCEKSCTLAINFEPVIIKQIELQIIEKGWEEGWVLPIISNYKSGKKVAIIGSGPAGLACAQQLVREGHNVVVFEKNNRVGGLLRYGIPDFKLEKHIIDRRIEQLKAEEIIFETDVNVGSDISINYLKRTFDAIVIAIGAYEPRDINVIGRDLKGIHFALDFLINQNQINAGDKLCNEIINAKDKEVVIIGGGDTGADCVGTAKRQGAKSITQIEILPEPPKERQIYNPWPFYPKIYTTTSSHEEGCKRLWSLSVSRFEGENGFVKKIYLKKIIWDENNKLEKTSFRESNEPEIEIKADLVLLATGFLHVKQDTMLTSLNIKFDEKGNIKVDNNYMTSEKKFFATGDSITGASLVVKAINTGRKVAEKVSLYLNSI